MFQDMFAGELATELLKELMKICRKACFCKSNAEKLKASIEEFLPIIREIQYAGVELPQLRQTQLDELTRNLRLGLELARKASATSRWNVYKNLQLAKKMEKVEMLISKFMKWPMMGHVLADVHHLRVDSCQRFDWLESAARRLEERLGSMKVGGVDGMVAEALRRFDEERDGDTGILGMKVAKEKVKEMVMGCVEVVGICGIGGSGKTSLAREVCRDYQIRSFFGDRIFFETVSQSPNVEQLKLKIWQQIIGGNYFNNSYPIPPWNLQFDWRARGPTLIVLDDVWSLTDLEPLIFKIPGCKTLVVSRFRFPMVMNSNSTFELELLGEEESLSLFCYSAFEQQTIPITADNKMVHQVVAECKGLPLALKVIGASMRGQPEKFWVRAKNKLARGEPISESHEVKLLERMAVSIECLSNKVRECFLDLGSFPEDKKIPLDVLINMWVEIHDLDEEDAFAILIELANKNLITLLKDAQDRGGDIYSSYSDLSVTQHDVLRDLALHINNCGNLNSRKRLIMPRRETRLPKDWERNKYKAFDAQIVSIHTGEMEEADWFQMSFPEAEVLILIFSSNIYFLPPFIETMPKLKALVLMNYGTSSTFLRNTSVFSSLNNLRSLWLEKITVPPLPKTTAPLQNLQKISLVLCEVNRSFNRSKVDLPLIFPRLSDLTIDHCIDLRELPSSIGRALSLVSLSITNCHDLHVLPDELGMLNSLQILRIYACPLLKTLPWSICGLNRLGYLDISQCVNLQNLPEGLGQLISLKKIDMRECSQIRNLPRSVAALRSLGHVVCDEEIACLWKEAEKVIPQLRVQVVEECFTLDWLVD